MSIRIGLCRASLGSPLAPRAALGGIAARLSGVHSAPMRPPPKLAFLDTARARLVALSLAAAALLAARSPEPAPPGEVPVWLWAWERPEDLRFLEGRADVGVAYLARTLVIAGDEVRVRPRRNPLRVEPGTPLTAVVRLEVPRGEPPSLAAVGRIAGEVRLALASGVTRRLQLDFDARASEVPFYRALLERVRASLPSDVWLGITALAAWCASDTSWLAERALPVDGVAPMAFSMGPDGARVRAWLAMRGGFSVDACRRDFGLSVAEPIAVPAGARVLYAFSPTAWTRDAFARVPKHASHTGAP